MWTTRQKHLTQALNNTALAIIAEAELADPVEAREMAELAVRLDELRIRLLNGEIQETDISQWPPLRPAA